MLGTKIENFDVFAIQNETFFNKFRICSVYALYMKWIKCLVLGGKHRILNLFRQAFASFVHKLPSSNHHLP